MPHAPRTPQDVGLPKPGCPAPAGRQVLREPRSRRAVRRRRPSAGGRWSSRPPPEMLPVRGVPSKKCGVGPGPMEKGWLLLRGVAGHDSRAPEWKAGRRQRCLSRSAQAVGRCHRKAVRGGRRPRAGGPRSLPEPLW